VSAVRVLPSLPVADGIEQARLLLPRCYLDAERCRPLLRALEHYRKDWDETRKTFALRPRHDWASHGADAFRHLAMGLRPARLAPRPPITITPPAYAFTRDGSSPTRPKRWGPQRGDQR
jgi:phage terminase large subunit